MDIKPAFEKDIIEIMFFFREIARHNIARNIFHWNYHNPSYDGIYQDVKNGELYIQRDKHLCAGVICMNDRPQKDFSALKWKENANPLTIQYFAVHPDWLESNIGEVLLDFANRTALENEYSSIHADVHELDEPHKKMLEEAMYKPVGEYRKEPQLLPFQAFEKEF